MTSYGSGLIIFVVMQLLGFLFIDPLYLLFAIPGIILAIVAQAMVKSAYAKASRIRTSSGLTGAEVAQMVLRSQGINYVKIESTGGVLTDHYHPVEKVLRLSEGNYNHDTLAAVGVAAHEAGHAIQHKQGYIPLVIRSALVPVSYFGSNLAFILFAIGLIASYGISLGLGKFMMLAAIFLFAAAVLFTLITLPVEFDASRRALIVLTQEGIVTQNELSVVKKVLTAAALTYVAAAVQALLTLLYLIFRYLLLAREE